MRAWGQPVAANSYDEQQSASWPAVSPWVLAVGGTNISLTPSNTIASSGVWNDTEFPAPDETLAGGGGGVSTTEKRPWWQTASQSANRTLPDVAAFAGPAPGYTIVCSSGVQSCPPTSGQTKAPYLCSRRLSSAIKAARGARC